MGPGAVEIFSAVPGFAIAMIMVMVDIVTPMADKRRAEFIGPEGCGNFTCVWDGMNDTKNEC